MRTRTFLGVPEPWVTKELLTRTVTVQAVGPQPVNAPVPLTVNW
ncbi:hypothetical protein ACFZCG_24195 [Streptomyces tanashiensis]